MLTLFELFGAAVFLSI